MASDHILPPTGLLRDDYDVKRAFARIEHELLASMMRNLGRHLKEEQDEGFDWSQWQVEQLKNLEEYRRRNRKEYGPRFKEINVKMEEAIRFAHENGQKDEELNILSAISQDRKIQPRYENPSQPSIEAAGDAFFRVNDDKLEALVEAAHSDMEKAEQAVLRRTNDQYRKIIFDAQVYANTGAGTVEQAVDMATKDFLAKGIDSIQYKNGARHTISDYADMYIRTAEKRAYLMGEGKKRQEWGESLVIVNRRGSMKNGNYGNACPQCIPWLGKILIDDVYSGGKPDGKHQLLSEAMAAGFLHPRCKDSFTTYIPGISPQEDPVTKQEAKKAVEAEKEENRLQYAERQQEKYERLAEYSFDEENQKVYQAKADRWEIEAEKYHQKANLEEDPLVRMMYERREEQAIGVSEDKELQNVFRRARYKDGAPTKTYVDITEHLLDNAVDDADYGELSEYTCNGRTYRVGDPGVLQRHAPEEKSIARFISRLTGKPVRMVPEISGKNQNVKTPDFIAGLNERWEIKDTKCSGKDPLRNEMSSKKAENYVFDVSRRVVDIEKIIEYTKQVFSAYNTTYVENVYIIENGKLVIALSRR